MSMRIKKLLPASWKGIPFFVTNEVMTEGGRRIILHDYPNSSERYVEDQGQMPPKFSVTAYISGVDFLDRAAQLERALNESGKGRLSMPTFGVQKLFALPYRKDASQTTVGEIRFELEFAAGRPTSGPVISDETEETVYAKGDEARSKLEESLEKIWSVPVAIGNKLAAMVDLQSMTDAVQGYYGTVKGAYDAGMDTVQQAQEFIENNTAPLTQNANLLASKINGANGVWRGISTTLSGGTGITGLLKLTRFGEGLGLSLGRVMGASTKIAGTFSRLGVPLWPQTTTHRKNRNKNRLTVVSAVRVNALVCAYEQAAAKTYATDAEIEQTRFEIEEAHRQIMQIDTDDRDLLQSQAEVREAVQAVRLAALAVLDRKEQQVFSLTTIKNNTPFSSFVQAYQLYAESYTTAEDATTRGLAVRALNPTLPADRLSGTISVFQV